MNELTWKRRKQGAPFELSKNSTSASPPFKDNSVTEMTKWDLSVKRSCRLCWQSVGILRRGRCLADALSVQIQETAGQKWKQSGVGGNCWWQRRDAKQEGQEKSASAIRKTRPEKALAHAKTRRQTQQQPFIFSQKRNLRDLILRAWILTDTNGDDGSTYLLQHSEFTIFNLFQKY